MRSLTERWLALDWHDPRVVAFVAAILLLALWRRWGLVLLAALLVALAQGLDYLLRHAAFGSGVASTAVLAVYAVGAAFLVFLAIARLVSRR